MNRYIADFIIFIIWEINRYIIIYIYIYISVLIFYTYQKFLYIYQILSKISIMTLNGLNQLIPTRHLSDHG